jgi:hypothetical protein
MSGSKANIYKECKFFEKGSDEIIVKDIQEGKSNLANHIKEKLISAGAILQLDLKELQFKYTILELNVIIKILKANGHSVVYDINDKFLTISNFNHKS